MGKHRPDYTPRDDMGDFVVVVNAGKLELTGNKFKDKIYYWHTGYPGGLKKTTPKMMFEKNQHPRILETAVKGMLPRNKLQKRRMFRLRIFTGPEHYLQDFVGNEDGQNPDSLFRDRHTLMQDPDIQHDGLQMAIAEARQAHEEAKREAGSE